MLWRLCRHMRVSGQGPQLKPKAVRRLSAAVLGEYKLAAATCVLGKIRRMLHHPAFLSAVAVAGSVAVLDAPALLKAA